MNKNTAYIDGKVDNVLKKVGSRIRAERQYQKLTREELEKLSGVSVDTIKRIEAGKTVKSDKLLRVILALDITFDLLFPQFSRPINTTKAAPSVSLFIFGEIFVSWNGNV